MLHNTDTIAALSTPPGESGIAVVRVSGPGAVETIAGLLRTASGRPLAGDLEHRRLYHAGFHDSQGDRVDDVMVAVMRAPETYTGEDVAEVSCHGGSAVVARVLEVLFATGARPAEPGEFTRRAFLNGKIDLIQAEAVADLIHARSELQRVVAERQLAGGLSRRIDALADEMLMVLGLIEANIDFIEEGIDALDVPGTLATLARQRVELDDLLATAPMARPLRDGFRVVIAGPVNAGKSSLFNRLVGESRAIVTEIPGTTRDVLRETLLIDGVPFVLHDTAGLRADSGDPIERIGIDRARDAAGSADVVLLVADGSAEAPSPAALVQAWGDLDAAHSIVVINKSDCPEDAAWRDARFDGVAVVRASAATGHGVDTLRETMVRLTGSATLVRTARARAVLNARLVSLLSDARVQLVELEQMVERRESFELLAAQARAVLGYYEDATGRRYQDGLLDAIFSRFCIGK